MHVREDHVIDLCRRYPLCLQRGEHMRHRVRGPGVDDGGPAVLHEQVDGGLQAAVIDAVHGANAVAVVEYARWSRAGETHGPL